VAAVGVLNHRRIDKARLAAGLSYGDLAYEIRRISDGRFRTNESQVRKWIKGEHRPSDGVVVVIAAATKQTVEYFYGHDEPDDDGEGRALRLSRIRAELIRSGRGDLVDDLNALAGVPIVDTLARRPQS
jgi:transcriptional regulator with XRE-family HTH domain